MVNGERVACSRLRDSRVRWNANMKKKKKKREETGERKGAQPTFRAPFTFASSPLSESSEPAGEQVAKKRTGKWKKRIKTQLKA